MKINLNELNSLVAENRHSIASMAEIIYKAKQDLSKKEYREFLDSTELSKDQVSRLLKRGGLLVEGFTKEDVGAYSDSMILKLTHKTVREVEELQLAKKELAKGEIDFEDFKIMFESFKIVKTDNEKFLTKIKGVTTALEKLEVNDVTLTEGANALKEFVTEWAD